MSSMNNKCKVWMWKISFLSPRLEDANIWGTFSWLVWLPLCSCDNFSFSCIIWWWIDESHLSILTTKRIFYWLIWFSFHDTKTFLQLASKGLSTKYEQTYFGKIFCLVMRKVQIFDLFICPSSKDSWAYVRGGMAKCCVRLLFTLVPIDVLMVVKRAFYK